MRSGPLDVLIPTNFQPANAGLGFDPGLGTLNSVSLTFTGTISARVGAIIYDSPPFPQTIELTPFVAALVGGSQFIAARFGPITVPLIVSGVEGVASVSAPATFDLLVNGADYDNLSLAADFTFSGISLSSPDNQTGAFFEGTAEAEFTFTPIPEPGTLALLGAGLAGLVAVRRRPASRPATWPNAGTSGPQ